MYLYLDESGDLGFDFETKKSSKTFVITILACFNDETRRMFRKAIQRTIKNKINRNKKKQRVQEIKGSKSDINAKKYFLRYLESADWKIYSIILNKINVNADLKSPIGKEKLYNLLARILIEELIPILRNTNGKVELIVDKSKSIEAIKEFNHYLESHLKAHLPLNVPLDIYHLRSYEIYELQAADIFCWGIFRKYEYQDFEWHNCFSDKIECEVEYLEEKGQRTL